MNPTPDRTLDDPQQIIADLQRELGEAHRALDESNAERDEYKTERDEALEQQTATAEVLGVINSSPGDLAPVFDAMLEKATSLCDAAFGIMLTWDGEYFHRVAFRGASPELIEALREPTRPGPATDRLTQGANLVHIPDVTAEEAYRSGNTIRRTFADVPAALVPAFERRAPVCGSRCAKTVCLAASSSIEPIGVIAVGRQRVEPFTERQIKLVRTFADQAVRPRASAVRRARF
jgi:GAF domain